MLLQEWSRLSHGVEVDILLSTYAVENQYKFNAS